MSAATAVALAAETSPAEDLDDGPFPSDAFVVDLDGWEGPLDLLLALARAQKVDLRRISIVALADQYLAYVAAARRASLELAAEYLVMAAWLAELKSRLLLPEPPAADEPSSDEMAAALAFQLRRMDAMREAGKRLLARPQLGRDFWQRGRPEAIPERLELKHALYAQLEDLIAPEAVIASNTSGLPPDRLAQTDILADLYRLARVEADAMDAALLDMAERDYDDANGRAAA